MSSRTLFAIFLFVLAPIAAVVTVSALLLFGVKPHTVFAPGWAVKSFIESLGIHAPNAVGVISTVGLWWLLFVAIGFVYERVRSKPHQ